MQRLFLIAAGAGAIFSVTSVAAAAMPAAPVSTDTPIVHVAGGCGPGMHPNPWGRCVPFGWGARRGPVVVVRPGYRRGWDGDRVYRRW